MTSLPPSPAPATGPGARPHSGDVASGTTSPAPALGRSIGERFDWHRRIRTRPRLAVGHLVSRSVAFGDLVGRPASSRALLQRSAPPGAEPVTPWATAGLPVRVPAAPYLTAWWDFARSPDAGGPSTGRLAGTATPGTIGRRPRNAPIVPVRGLPQAVSRRMRSRVGESTGPTGASERMVTAPLPIRRAPEVTAVGSVLTTREANRIGPRETRSRPSPAARPSGDPDRPGPTAGPSRHRTGSPGGRGPAAPGRADHPGPSGAPAPPRPELVARSVTDGMVAAATAAREGPRAAAGRTRPSTGRPSGHRRAPVSSSGLLRTLRTEARAAVTEHVTGRAPTRGAYGLRSDAATPGPRGGRAGTPVTRGGGGPPFTVGLRQAVAVTPSLRASGPAGLRRATTASGRGTGAGRSSIPGSAAPGPAESGPAESGPAVSGPARLRGSAPTAAVTPGLDVGSAALRPGPDAGRLLHGERLSARAAIAAQRLLSEAPTSRRTAPAAGQPVKQPAATPSPEVVTARTGPDLASTRTGSALAILSAQTDPRPPARPGSAAVDFLALPAAGAAMHPGGPGPAVRSGPGGIVHPSSRADHGVPGPNGGVPDPTGSRVGAASRSVIGRTVEDRAVSGAPVSGPVPGGSSLAGLVSSLRSAAPMATGRLRRRPAGPLAAAWRAGLGRVEVSAVLARAGLTPAPPSSMGAGTPALPSSVVARTTVPSSAEAGPSGSGVRRSSAAPAVLPAAVRPAGAPPRSVPNFEERTVMPVGAHRLERRARRSLLRSTASGASGEEARRRDRAAGERRAGGGAGAPHGPIRPVAFAAHVAPATRFTSVMRTGRPDPVGALPHHLRSLAVALAGPGPIGVRTGPTTRSALAAAGKRAATVGRVIHLDATPDRSPATTEIVAHELTHVARPSRQARFFADDRHTPEERLAVRVGGLARSLATTEVAPPARRSRTDPLPLGTAGLAVGGGQTFAAAGSAGPAVSARADSARRVRRLVTPSDRAPEQGRTGTGGVRSLIQQFETLGRGEGGGRPDPAPSGPDGRTVGDGSTGNASTVGGSTVGGSTVGHAGDPASSLPASAGQAGTPSLPMVVRPPSPGAGSPFAPAPFVQTGASPVNSAPSPVGSSTAPVSEETLEWIIERIEQRIIDELERRGMRHNPGVF